MGYKILGYKGFFLIFTLLSADVYAQSEAAVFNKPNQAGYIKLLQAKVAEFEVVLSGLNQTLAEVGPRLITAEKNNNAYNTCAQRIPPMLYAGEALGCVSLEPAPCELCNP